VQVQVLVLVRVQAAQGGRRRCRRWRAGGLSIG